MGFIKGLFQVVWPLISGFVKTAWAIIKTEIKVALDIILGIIKIALDILTGHWDKVWKDIKVTAKNIWNDIINTFKGINLEQIGKDIINGLIHGIKSMAGAVWKEVKAIGSGVTGVIKNVLGIHSPSRVMMELGGYVTDGLAIGMNNNAHKVLDASYSLSQASIPTINSNSNSTMSKNSMNNQTPISVVLNYTGNSPEDAVAMANIVEKEFLNRFGSRMIMAGVRS
jgi:phage-related protein